LCAWSAPALQLRTAASILQPTIATTQHPLPFEHSALALQLKPALLEPLPCRGRKCALCLVTMPRTKFRHFPAMPFTQAAKRLPLLLSQRFPAPLDHSAAPLRHRCCCYARDQCCHEQKSSRVHCVHPPSSTAPEIRRSFNWTARARER
jgi:hypothetical protein